MSQNSSGQALLIGVLAGALIVAIGAASFFYISSKQSVPVGEKAIVTEPSKTEKEPEITSKTLKVPPPQRVDAFNELFNVKTKHGKIKTAKYKLSSIWFDKKITYKETNYYVVFSKTQTLSEETGELEECHACSAEVGAITYKETEKEWEVVSKDKNISSFGSWGDAPDVKPEAIQLSKNVIAFLLESGYSNQGYTSTSKTIFSFSGDSWQEIGSIGVHEDNYGTCDETPPESEESAMGPCWQYDGTISISTEQEKDYPDLLVMQKGTMKNESGKIFKPENNVYRFDGKSYVSNEKS